jgi:hypothetical protein
MKSPPLFPKQAAAVAVALLALAVLPGCKKAAKPAAPAAPKPAAGAAAAGTNTAAGMGTNLGGEFVSVFDDSPPPGNKGRDPFNPNSAARNLIPPPTAPGTAAGTEDTQLKLQSVVGSPGRWLAVINNHILAVNDPPETIKLPDGGSVLLKVVEIGKDYAYVTLNGSAEKKRLTMNPKE